MRSTIASRVCVPLVAVAMRAWVAGAAPVNDVCTDATVVPDDFANRYFDIVDAASLTSAGVDATEPMPGCTTAPVHSIWYAWTAPADGALLVKPLCIPPYTVKVALWSGTCDAPVATSGCTVESCGDLSPASTIAVAGVTYLVQVGTDAPPTTDLTTEICLLGPDEDDEDGDTLADCVDPCTDSDFDDFGDGPLTARPFDSCPADNCVDVYNPDQADKDGDGIGDACDNDEEKDVKTLEEAADDGDVELSDKICFSGDCVRITVRNRGTRPLLVNARPGDVLVSRDDGEQDLGVTKPIGIYVPPGGTATIGGIYTVCLQSNAHAPSRDRIYDVTDHLSGATDRASLAALLQLLSTPVTHSKRVTLLQDAAWAITDDVPPGARSAALLRAAGLDPDALPTGFPSLPNPNAGSTDPTSHRLAGLLINAPIGGAPNDGGCSGAPLQTAACLLDRVQTLAAALPDTVKRKLRAKIGHRIAGVRGKIDAASRATKPRKAVKLQRAALARARTLAGMLGKAASKGKLPSAEARELVDAVNQVAAALV